jgi:predicted ArsR family transcriptional regulator
MYNQNIQYRQTDQGAKTRSHLLKHLNSEPVSREELMARSGLTYDQVRRQTRNLSISGEVVSKREGGKRFYCLRQVASSFGACALALCVAWSAVPSEQRLHQSSRNLQNLGTNLGQVS